MIRLPSMPLKRPQWAVPRKPLRVLNLQKNPENNPEFFFEKKVKNRLILQHICCILLL